MYIKAHFGIQDTALAWFKSYLEGRQQSVSINGTMSETKILNTHQFWARYCL